MTLGIGVIQSPGSKLRFRYPSFELELKLLSVEPGVGIGCCCGTHVFFLSGLARTEWCQRVDMQARVTR